MIISKIRTYHKRLGAGLRTAERRGRAGPGRTGCRHAGSPRRQPTFLPSKASRKITDLPVSPEARTHEFLYKPVESKTRTYHGQVGMERRTAERRGGAGPGRTGCREAGSPRRQPTFLPSKASKKTTDLHVSPEARTHEILYKPVESKTRTYHGQVGMERRTAGRRGRARTGRMDRRRVGSPKRQSSLLLLEENPPGRVPASTDINPCNRWRNKTCGKPTVHPRVSAGPRALFIPGCWPVYRRRIVSVKYFSCKACPRIGGGTKPAVDPRFSRG